MIIRGWKAVKQVVQKCIIYSNIRKKIMKEGHALFQEFPRILNEKFGNDLHFCKLKSTLLDQCYNFCIVMNKVCIWSAGGREWEGGGN